MTVKVFCDTPGCGREIKHGMINFEVTVGRGAIRLECGTMKPGDICKYCVIDAFKKLDDRTQPDRNLDVAPSLSPLS